MTPLWERAESCTPRRKDNKHSKRIKVSYRKARNKSLRIGFFRPLRRASRCASIILRHKSALPRTSRRHVNPSEVVNPSRWHLFERTTSWSIPVRIASVERVQTASHLLFITRWFPRSTMSGPRGAYLSLPSKVAAYFATIRPANKFSWPRGSWCWRVFVFIKSQLRSRDKIIYQQRLRTVKFIDPIKLFNIARPRTVIVRSFNCDLCPVWCTSFVTRAPDR